MGQVDVCHVQLMFTSKKGIRGKRRGGLVGLRGVRVWDGCTREKPFSLRVVVSGAMNQVPRLWEPSDSVPRHGELFIKLLGLFSVEIVDRKNLKRVKV